MIIINLEVRERESQSVGMFSLFQKGVGGGNGEQVAFLSHLIILVITL